MRLKVLISLTWGALLLSGIQPAAAQAVAEDAFQTDKTQVSLQVTRPYIAEYDVTRRGKVHGKAGRVLTKVNENEWHYETYTQARLFILSDNRQHQTNFKVSEGRVISQAFEYHRTGTGKDKHFEVVFDNQAQRLILPEHAQGSLPEWRPSLLDSNAVLHQLQIDLTLYQKWPENIQLKYDLLDEAGELKVYEFEIIGKETVQLPFGVMDTIKVKRVRDTNRRETYFWFSPIHNFTLVQMQQLKEGKEEVKLELRSLQFSASSSEAYP